MDVSEAIETRLEIREFTDEPVPDGTKRAILNAGRLSPSAKNIQHWRFVLIDDDETLEELGERSPTGGWVAGADFAVAVVTDPEWPFAGLDAGRAITHMQLAAWELGVGSCVYTVDAPEAHELLDVPEGDSIEVVAGFGHPTREVEGRKDREPLSELVYHDRYGAPLDL